MGKKEVIKHSAAIQISNDISLLERRIWNLLLANAYNDLPKKEIYEISIKELGRLLKFDSNNIKFLKESLRRLRNTNVEWNVLNKDNQKEWGVAGLLAEAKIINGVCFYEYSSTLRKNLHNPAIYAKINLLLQNKFKSKYALALYELMADYYRVGETPFIPLEELRKLLGLESNAYPDFKELNRYVIKKALSEINRKSDLNVEAIHKRRQRKVNAIKFRIKKIIFDTPLIETGPAIEPQQHPLRLAGFGIDNQTLFETLTVEFGVASGKAAEILKTSDEFYIEDVLEKVRELYKAGKIDNLAGFTVKAIENDYRSQKPAAEIEKEEQQKTRERLKQEKQILERLKMEFHRERIEKTIRALDALPVEKTAALIKEFENTELKTASAFVQKGYAQKGLDSSAVKPLFRSFAARRLLPPEDAEFEAYAAEQGVNINN